MFSVPKTSPMLSTLVSEIKKTDLNVVFLSVIKLHPIFLLMGFAIKNLQQNLNLTLQDGKWKVQ